MIYISKDGDVINAASPSNHLLKYYDNWLLGQEFVEMQTSGSTGVPKTIEISREAILASIQMTKKAFNLNSDDFFLCNLNTDYIGGRMMIYRAAEINTDLMGIDACANPFEVLERYLHFFSQNWGKNFFSFVPLQLRNVLQTEKHIQLLRTAKAILVGGGPVAQDLIPIIQHHNLPVFETYGMTETVSHIAIKDLRENTSFFKTLEGVQIKTNEDNCLVISSPSTLGQWISTNDIVEIHSENTFTLKGRKDNIINSGGIKIQLEEIERKIAEKISTPVSFFAFGVPDQVLGQKLILVVENAEIDLNLISENLEKYHIPKNIFSVEHFERTESGKIDKIKTVEKLIL